MRPGSTTYMLAPAVDAYEQRYMDPGESVLFREKVVSKAAFGVSVVFAVVFGLFGLAPIAMALLGQLPAPLALIGVLSSAFGIAMGVLGVMFSVFRVMVTASNVHVHFGWVKRKIPMSAIQTVRAVKLRGFRQGKVSVGFDGIVRTWTGNSVSGDGVEITYQDEGARKHIITIGSEEAARFVEMIERQRKVRVERVEGVEGVVGEGVEGVEAAATTTPPLSTAEEEEQEEVGYTPEAR